MATKSEIEKKNLTGKASSLFSGLTEQQAITTLKLDGPNELQADEQRTMATIVMEVLREPMMALLVAGGIIYFLLGDIKEAILLTTLACFSIFITVWQEMRTEQVLHALRNLTSPRALVIRDGDRKRIPAREVVCGDLMVLAEGDRVPADAIILQNHDLEADESLLTGESVPVLKVEATQSDAVENQHPGGNLQPWVFSGTLIVRGSAICEVTATGARSEIGKIGLSLGSLDRAPPRLQVQMRHLVRIFGLIALVVCTVVITFYGIFRDNWLDGILAGIALGMSLLPEEFPVVLTVFMAMGAWRISKARVLTRRVTAIETLGSATVLCTDKTGTLTENRMSIAELVLPDGRQHMLDSGQNLGEECRQLAAHGILACTLDPFDPMEIAFHDLTPMAFPSGHPGRGNWALVKEYGLTAELLAVTQVWATEAGSNYSASTKGAPEAIAALCHLEESKAAGIRKLSEQMADKGLRVLAVAQANHSGTMLPDTPQDFAFHFLGLVGLADGLRPEVSDAVAQCRSAGIRVVMITGDYPATALAIARQAGIADVNDEVITGRALAGMDDEELAGRLASVHVFARIMPEQKLKIVDAFKSNGEIVAMTGDGVNDAPSLKAAHIGIGMGARGTDVAREASSIVLLDDNFGSIVQAVQLGRRIYDNIRKASLFILALHLPIAGLALVPLAFSLPIVLWPLHIALLEMIIDPICSLVFEAEEEEEDIMRRPPRSPEEKLLPKPLVIWGIVEGAMALVITGGVYFWGIAYGYPDGEIRALTFLTLILNIFILVLVNRSYSVSMFQAFLKPNQTFWIVVAIVFVLFLIIFMWPAANEILLFSPLEIEAFVMAAIAPAILLAISEFMKLLFKPTRGY
ncbi:cation-translocating P-type ATPase [Cohaesibacter celericrescens]|uniref:ATPase n=1 Tax=Cohaesibacter celericrescens TaxID=2067669 RepID=A0A2N5XVD7_9HYPH|nr:cation-translocating P-type ATPase [Cohaesibacter celericrescens]PLW78473.1 ATPase [Cohaesibacter celericrescens]